MARHYGIPYMGSKQKLVDKIVPFILKRHPGVDGSELAKEVHTQDAYARRVGDGVRVKAKPSMGFHARAEE